jgi:DMSO/TMAO reductase YedYZ heme-binding membrane subunit
MSVAYRPVQWNAFKLRYDLILGGAIVLYVATFVFAAKLALKGDRAISDPILLMRALGTCAIVLLHIVLCIGPLVRLDRRFLPLLYNRRHLGVLMFTLALSHGVFSIVQFHALGTLNPLVSVLVSNQRYTSISQVPFQALGLAALVILFVMAATSHDFWLHNLTAPVWKALHMGVYLAYTFIVLHVAFGVLQGETSRLLGWTLCGGVLEAASRRCYS